MAKKAEKEVPVPCPPFMSVGQCQGCVFRGGGYRSIKKIPCFSPELEKLRANMVRKRKEHKGVTESSRAEIGRCKTDFRQGGNCRDIQVRVREEE